ncbi:MAG: 3-deoxy-7-phosphoheptulonate synthase [Gammaproteobacteria bacterium]|nr:3-deoxy-7-phosphoheptulonate synthase [Gammaproteobacteria bacterium]
MFHSTDDERIAGYRPLISPAILMEELPVSEQAANTVAEARRAAEAVVRGEDDRLLVVTGPCSIHDPKAALEYADRLQSVKRALSDDLCIIMRVYFEKPRTTIGWKGLINDPHLDGTFDINNGLRAARRLLLDLAHRGMPAGSEFLDVITPQFVADLMAWGAIGARTTESQIHRELASGSSMPIGFKNGTDGSVQIAVDAIGAARHPHHFLSVTKQSIAAIVTTRGNDTCHLILRGSNNGPNHDAASVAAAGAALRAAGLRDRIMIDCSHGNSRKDHRQQPAVTREVCAQVADGSQLVCGVMLESHLKEGKQNHSSDTPLVYGQSITDACMSWETTEPLLHELADAVRRRRAAS